jgi:hypothetical protein
MTNLFFKTLSNSKQIIILHQPIFLKASSIQASLNQVESKDSAKLITLMISKTHQA